MGKINCRLCLNEWIGSVMHITFYDYFSIILRSSLSKPM